MSHITISAPSACLPPLRELSSYSAYKITPLLDLIRILYQPDVRGIGSEPPDAHDSGYASDASQEDEDSPHKSVSLESLRQDRFERSNSIKWLVGFVARAEEWAEEAATDAAEREARDNCVEEAIKVLGTCSGVSASGSLTRTFDFAHGSGDPIVVHLRDASLDSQDHTCVGLQTWGSSCILARMVISDPSTFGLFPGTKPQRILELGAGTGLLSIALSKMMAGSNTEVVATDFHPAVLENLRSNVASNFFEFGDITPPEVHFLDWSKLNAMVLGETDCTLESPFDKPFDIIFGTDIIYEPQHAEWIRSTVQLLLAPNNEASFHLIMPARPTHEMETAAVPTIFASSDDARAGVEGSFEIDRRLVIRRVEKMDRMTGTGRTDEVHYLLYNIGWNVSSS